ncbi:PREDICTED: uncharacterized protein LOC106816730 [Priapulus caudatus]|uniref:Uncharacterized protein LOC106816730 n=1 Tax=Priapulus caudatus TaxID=37621 RepID=A0ABM1EXB2_PRICU|nr:PREDICTED: uncharacterized protein LOC106816730 [Priapulus caudatus]
MHPTILPGDDTQEVLTATSLYILNPGEGSPDALRVCDEPERCGYFDLLLGLVIALGILLLFCVILLLCLWPCAYSRCCRAGAADDERKEEIPEYFATKDSTDWGSTIPFRFVPQYNSDSNRDSYDTRSDVTKESNNTMGTKSWHRAFSVHSTPIFTNYPVVLPDGQQAPPGAPHSVTGYMGKKLTVVKKSNHSDAYFSMTRVAPVFVQ